MPGRPITQNKANSSSWAYAALVSASKVAPHGVTTSRACCAKQSQLLCQADAGTVRRAMWASTVMRNKAISRRTAVQNKANLHEGQTNITAVRTKGYDGRMRILCQGEQSQFLFPGSQRAHRGHPGKASRRQQAEPGVRNKANPGNWDCPPSRPGVDDGSCKTKPISWGRTGTRTSASRAA